MADTHDAQRRVILQLAAGLAASAPLGVSQAADVLAAPAATGKAGDFDFLNGRARWKTANPCSRAACGTASRRVRAAGIRRSRDDGASWDDNWVMLWDRV